MNECTQAAGTEIGRSGDGNAAKSSSDGVHFLSEQNKSKCFHSVPNDEDELGP